MPLAARVFVPPAHIIDRVMVAVTEEQHRQGLKDLKKFPANAGGMLFVFKRPGPVTITMVGVLFPLDIVFLSPERKVTKVITAEPGTAQVPWEGSFVLELPAGFAGRAGISVGKELQWSVLR